MIDMSRGGMAIRSDWKLDAGTEIQAELPGAGSPVTARAVRWQDGVLALAFRQDEATLRLVDKVLERIVPDRKAAA